MARRERMTAARQRRTRVRRKQAGVKVDHHHYPDPSGWHAFCSKQETIPH
jgi:hypothetical protein